MSWKTFSSCTRRIKFDESSNFETIRKLKPMLCQRLIIIFTVSLQLMSPSAAKSSNADFAPISLSEIIESYKNNALKFDKQIRGKSFAGELTFQKIERVSDSAKYRLIFRVGATLQLFGYTGGVECILSNPYSLREVQSWGVGSSLTGRLVRTRGIINSVSSDNLILTQQKIIAVGGTPAEIASRPELECD